MSGVLKSLSASLPIAGLLLLGACDQAFQDRNYDMVEVGGETYLLDRDSGSVYVRQNGELVALVAREPVDPAVLSEVQSFGPVSLSPRAGAGVTVEGRYKYADGTLKYIADVGVSLGENAAGSGKDVLAKTYERIALNFLDQDGFRVATGEIDLQGASMSTATAAGGEGNAPSYRFEGRLPLNPQEFSTISTAAVSWREAEPAGAAKPANKAEPALSNES